MTQPRSLGVLRYVIAAVMLVATAYLGGFIHSRFLLGGRPPWFEISIESHEHDHEHEEEHEHEHENDGGGGSNDVLELSPTAQKNLGLTAEYLRPIELSAFTRTVTVPGIIVERPGRTRLPISSSISGIVTHVHAIEGEAVESGDLILEMRLTHEDVVTAQRDFLQSLGDLDVEQAEIDRIEAATRNGSLPSKQKVDREYARDKLKSLLRSQREALRLHGLTDAQLDKIEKDRRLLTDIKIYAPIPDDHDHAEVSLSKNDLRRPKPMHLASGEVTLAMPQTNRQAATKGILVLQELNVQKGQVVNVGDRLGTIVDYQALLIEGQAFESEASLITLARRNEWKVKAILDVGNGSSTTSDLDFGWVENAIDPKTRTMKFYIELPNQLDHESRNETGQRFVDWKYKTGQRVQLRVPVENWVDQMVLPVDAVIQDGVDSFIFQQNGDRFQRVPVHERYRDQSSVVIDNDGSLFPGDVVALRGAHQMQMSLKNKAGGGADPHAGHSH